MKVFISYSSKEEDKAAALETYLSKNGITCWRAPGSIPSGSNYAEIIVRAIKSCDVFVVVLSEFSQQSKYVIKELDAAIKYDIPVIPFHVDQSNVLTDAFDFLIGNVQRIEAYGRVSEAYKTLLKQLKASGSVEQNTNNLISVKENSDITDGMGKPHADQLQDHVLEKAKESMSYLGKTHETALVFVAARAIGKGIETYSQVKEWSPEDQCALAQKHKELCVQKQRYIDYIANCIKPQELKEVSKRTGIHFFSADSVKYKSIADLGTFVNTHKELKRNSEL